MSAASRAHLELFQILRWILSNGIPYIFEHPFPSPPLIYGVRKHSFHGFSFFWIYQDSSFPQFDQLLFHLIRLKRIAKYVIISKTLLSEPTLVWYRNIRRFPLLPFLVSLLYCVSLPVSNSTAELWFLQIQIGSEKYCNASKYDISKIGILL